MSASIRPRLVGLLVLPPLRLFVRQKVQRKAGGFPRPFLVEKRPKSSQTIFGPGSFLLDGGAFAGERRANTAVCRPHMVAHTPRVFHNYRTHTYAVVENAVRNLFLRMAAGSTSLFPFRTCPSLRARA